MMGTPEGTRPMPPEAMSTDALPTDVPPSAPTEAEAAREELNPTPDAPAGTPAGDAYFVALRQLRGKLTDDAGQDYKAFRATLKPDFRRAWRDLLPAHAAIAATLVALVTAQPMFPGAIAQAGLVPAGAAVLGALFNYINLFQHEAAHYGLHPDRAANDRLGYAFVGIFLGVDMAAYRKNHFEHHRALGEPGDTEHTYFDAPGWGLVFGLLSGTYALRKALTSRYLLGATGDAAPAAGGAAPAAGGAARRRSYLPLAGGLAFHAAIVGALLALGAWAAAAAWVLGMAAVFPLLGAMRQVLEHRAEEASAAVDYARVPHGATSRLFGDGPFASFYGAAGFNRHLLHHFEPAVSYTRLAELEAFLRRTAVAPYLESRTTTYFRTLRALFGRP